MKYLLLIVICFSLLVSISAQSNYYVSSSKGNDNNSGSSPDSTLRSLTYINELAALGVFQEGDSILFKRGDEWKGEFLYFGEELNGDNSNPITLSSFGAGTKPIFNGLLESIEFDTSQITGITIKSPNFNISNLEIKNYLKDGINANVGSNKILNLFIDSVYVHNTGSTYFTYVYGIYTEGKNTKILHSLITDTYNDGIFMLGADCELGFSQIINAGSGPRGDALQLKYADNFWIHDNIMTSDDLDHGIAITKQREGDPEFIGGIFERNYCEGNLWGLDVGGYGTIVRYNQFISNRAYGLKIRGHYTKAYDNFIKNTEQGIALGEPWVTGLTGYIELYNNTVVNTSEYALILTDYEDSAYVNCMNNIFTEINGVGLKRTKKIILVNGKSDYNLFYPDNKPGLFIAERDTLSSLAQWQEYSSSDQHSISMDPILVNDFCLSDFSPALNKGIDLSFINKEEFNLDINGFYRNPNSSWDIGACENLSKNIGIDTTTLNSIETGDQNNSNLTSPNVFNLLQNYPNPFNPTTKIKYTIPSAPLSVGEGLGVRLEVYDVLGNEVATLVNEQQPAGIYEVEFNALENISLSSGVYYYQLRAGSFVETKKMILLR